MGNQKILFNMYKLAAVTAIAAAASIDEYKQTAELFTIQLKQEEVEGLEKHGKALEREGQKYEMQMQKSAHAQQFQMEGEALVHTKEFVALAKLVEAIKKAGPTEQMKKVKAAYMAQVQKLEMAHMKLQRSTQQNMKVTGENPLHRAQINVDNDEWIAFNKEYYKLREMEYYIQYKVQEVVAVRKSVKDLVDTDEFETMEDHWETVTDRKQHQVVVAHQGALVKAAVQCLHLTKEDEKWMDPAHSPVMIDGEYDDDFVDAVKPKFPAPENYPDNLYLF